MSYKIIAVMLYEMAQLKYELQKNTADSFYLGKIR